MSVTNVAIDRIIQNSKKKKKNTSVVQKTVRPQVYVRRDRIATGTDKAHKKGHASMRDHWAVALFKRGYEDALGGLADTAVGDPAIAIINNGRWIALCPDPDCTGAELIDPADPVFMCLSCGNIKNKILGVCRLRPVQLPGGMAEIVKPLLQRPRINRNWIPKQTEKDLWEENIENYEKLYKGSHIPKEIAKEFGWKEPEEIV